MKPYAAILPCAIVASGITVAQLHGVGFWMRLFGEPWIGWTVSLTWEGASVWLWWRRDKDFARRSAKYLATGALVLGMAAQSTAPLLTAATEAEAGKTVLEILQGQTEAGNWISQTTLKTAFAASGGLPPSVLIGVAWATILIMPALYALAILALVTMAREWNSAPNPNHGNGSAKHANYREANPGALILTYGNRHGLKYQSEVAKKIRERESTLSEFRNGKLTGEPARRIAAKLKKSLKEKS